MKKTILLCLGLLLSISMQTMYAQGGSSSKKISTYKGKEDNTATSQLLQALGATTAQGIFITYFAVGSTADAYVKGAYDKPTTIQVLESYYQTTEAVNSQLKTLLNSKTLSSADVKYINGVREVYLLLEAEIKAFKDYIETADNSYVSIYDDNRTKAWAKISALLNLK